MPYYQCPRQSPTPRMMYSFLTKLILYLFRFSPSRRQVKGGQIDEEELLNDLKFVIADTKYIARPALGDICHKVNTILILRVTFFMKV